jgi:hypothetical protein
MKKACCAWELKLLAFPGRMPVSGDHTVKRKIAAKGVGRSEVPGLAVSVAAGTLVGATVGKVVKRTNGSAMTGAAVGAVAGGLLGKRALSKRRQTASDLAQIADYVKQHLGFRTTAYLTGVDDAELVDRWVEGSVQPEPLPAERLRSAFEATRHLVEAYDAQTARSWFLGMNPTFDDVAPAQILREGRDSQAWEDVVLAAQEFAEN